MHRVLLQLAFAAIALATALPASGQQATVRVSRKPYYVGVPVIIEISTEGFEDSPEPTVSAPDPRKGRLTFIGQTGSSTNTVIINGRMTVDVTKNFRFRFVGDEPGAYIVGPFTVQQGATRSTARSLRIDLEEVQLSDVMRIRMVLPEKPVFIGQRVPVGVEWWVQESEQENLLSRLRYDFSVPLFTLGSSFNFIDEEVRRGEDALRFPTDTADVQLGIDIERQTVDGTRFLVLTATRIMVPLKTGDYDLGAATITADRITGWVRDRSGFFPRKEPQFEKIRARDLPRQLVVRQLPLAGQPPSFAGAVGRGFSLEVSADRTVVQVGDPITLTLILRGEGSLETAGLPPLSADGGMDATRFRLPGSEVAGILQDDGGKVFEVKVRVLDPTVREIPGIAYSWFDTESNKYQTVRSRPIALSVSTVRS